MENQIPWDIVLKSVNDKTFKDDGRLTSWLNESKANQQLYDELNVIYTINGCVPDYYVPNQRTGWQKVESRIAKSKPKVKLIYYFTRFAASVLLFMLGAGVFWVIDQNVSDNNFTEVVSPYGHKTMVMLPDSSLVWINGDSKLRYKTNFQKERILELEGEALFDVRKDPRKLFSVKSNTIRVEVYGTRFNFRTYKNDTEVEVALLQGSVGVFIDEQCLKTMHPGEVVTYIPEKNKLITSGSQNLNHITSWRSDELVIDNLPVTEIFKYIERWYGVQIEYDDKIDKDKRLTFKVKTESLRELLSIIRKVYPFNYTIDGKKVKITKS